MASLRGNSWQARVKAPDKYHRYSFPTRSLAEAWEKQARQEVAAGVPVTPPTVIPTDDPTLHQFFADQGKNIWPYARWDNVMRNQRAVEAAFGYNTLLREVTTIMVQDVKASMREKGMSPSTINTRLYHLGKLLAWARKRGIEVDTVEIELEKKRENTRMRFLSVEEETKLLVAMRNGGFEPEAEFVEVLIDTGCRPSELIWGTGDDSEPITWAEVSENAGGTDSNLDGHAVITLNRTKTDTWRVIYLTERAARNFIKSRQLGDERPFGNLRVNKVSSIFRHFADQAGLHDVVLYTCRHTCASRLVQRGADIRRVMQWMGHSDIQTTLRYAKLNPSDVQNLKELL